METNKKFPAGINFDRPRDGSPDFVKGRMGINLERLLVWAKENNLADDWINFDLLLSKDGTKLYFSLNDWKKTATAPSTTPKTALEREYESLGEQSPVQIEYPAGEPKDIPF